VPCRLTPSLGCMGRVPARKGSADRRPPPEAGIERRSSGRATCRRMRLRPPFSSRTSACIARSFELS
jgi:hypothetical protein